MIQRVSRSVKKNTISSSQIGVYFNIALEYLHDKPESSVDYVLTTFNFR